MDDATLHSLKEALALTPDNPRLLVMVLRGHLARGEGSAAHELLVSSSPQFGDPDDQALAARVCLAVDAHAGALSHLKADAPELDLLRAQALLGLGQRDDARAAYEAAVEANPTLEDGDLRASIGARERDVEPPRIGGPRLRVISNDDTDAEDSERLLMPALEAVSFEDVGGLGAVKKQIHKRIILPFQKPSLFKKFRKRAGGGILLYGPPGCGKTLLARATAGECNAQFFSISISDILDMYIGESERKLHAIFDRARSSTPAVLFFDELEGLAGKRQYSREGTSAKLVSQFLSEMDGFSQNNEGVLILGATNVPWAVDPAFRRPGRFDRIQFVPPPDREARAAILQILLKDRPAAPIDSGSLAKRTQGFSGADLSHLVESATDEAIEASLEQGDEVPITMEHFKQALQEVRPTTLEWLTTARNYARYANEGGQYDDVLEFLKKHGK